MTDAANPSLDAFLDAIAQRQPTPGGGGVSAAAGALGCAMARMVAAYSPGKGADPQAVRTVAELTGKLDRADHLMRRLIDEDALAYAKLTAAAKRARTDPAARPEHDTALGVAIAVPLQIAALSAESLSVMEGLLPIAGKYLLSDLGVAAVLADASTHAAAYMVRVNTAALPDDAQRRDAEREIGRLTAKSGDTRARIESALRQRV